MFKLIKSLSTQIHITSYNITLHSYFIRLVFSLNFPSNDHIDQRNVYAYLTCNLIRCLIDSNLKRELKKNKKKKIYFQFKQAQVFLKPRIHCNNK